VGPHHPRALGRGRRAERQQAAERYAGCADGHGGDHRAPREFASSRSSTTSTARVVCRKARNQRTRMSYGTLAGGSVSRLEAIDTHALPVSRRSAWICLSGSASLRVVTDSAASSYREHSHRGGLSEVPQPRQRLVVVVLERTTALLMGIPSVLPVLRPRRSSLPPPWVPNARNRARDIPR
jgi:hypothetical protein